MLIRHRYHTGFSTGIPIHLRNKAALMHRYVTHNRFYPSQKTFTNAILGFFRETIPKKWHDFRDQVTDNFRVISHQNFRVLE